jgi:broad specificity phosphatase PhoE
MKPDRIFIVRHGQSEGNADRSIYSKKPDYTVELTERGQSQALEAGERIGKIITKGVISKPSVQFYVSPYWRTRQTYLGILKGIKNVAGENRLRHTYYEDPRLREQEWGQKLENREGWRDDLEVTRDSFGHFYWRFPEGESCADVFDRVSDFLGTVFRDFKKVNYARNVVIVTHGMTMRLLLMRWFHATVEEYESWGNPWNCEILILQRTEEEKYELITPIKLHQIGHEYVFNWGEHAQYGVRKCPTRTQQEPIYPE